MMLLIVSCTLEVTDEEIELELEQLSEKELQGLIDEEESEGALAGKGSFQSGTDQYTNKFYQKVINQDVRDISRTRIYAVAKTYQSKKTTLKLKGRGNKKLDFVEICDDGNTNNGDGCSSNCQKEEGWICTDPVYVAPSRYSPEQIYASSCTPTCGDDLVKGSEKCDGVDLSGTTCANLGKGTGKLVCSQDCKTFDTSGCISLEQAYDKEGRLTDYALSFAPKKLTLNLQDLPELYPEKYGKNYFTPGTYKIKEGDGFGKGDFLIKFIKFVPEKYYYKDNSKFVVEETGRIYFEVFKKESDNNYYHFPTLEKFIGNYDIKDLFGISLESVND